MLAPPDIAALRFLVVEDHGFQRWALQRMLQDLGATHVYAAEDGHAALELLASLEQAVDIIVSDLEMPGMDGMEFIRRVGEDRRSASLIVASGHDPALLASVERMAQAYGVRFLAAIQKPATLAKLQEAIQSHSIEGAAQSADASPLAVSAEEMRGALGRGEFAAYFQPKVDVRSGRMVGAEALARWLHPARGKLLPRSFLAQLERHDLAAELTDAMLATACSAAHGWQRHGIHASVSVNVSVLSLAEVGTAERLVRCVEACDVSPRDVILEVTESTAATDLGKVLENLSRLRMRGFGLSIDDYGTGYSSMQQLTRVPFTELKIDQSFVKNAHAHAPSRAMLESSLELARKLDIQAVAEGVETDREWRLVRELGCPLAQGYFLGRPMPLAEFLAFARRAPVA